MDGGGFIATNDVFGQDPGNATALTVIGPVGSVFPPDFVRDPPDNYVYNSNLGSPQMCALVDVMAGTQGRAGDTLAREWSRVRSRPNLTNSSEEHTSELQSLMRPSSAVFCLKKTPPFNDKTIAYKR